MANGSDSKLGILATAVVLWVLVFSLSCRITAGPAAAAGLSGSAGSVAELIFGRSRRAIGLQFYETADRYFHRGVPHRKERAFDSGFFLDLALQVAPESHLHLEGDEVTEMMPWLWMSIRMDPHNIEPYRVAAFWLAGEAGRPELARDVLEEAHKNNPLSYQVRLDMGRMALKQGDAAGACESFDAALALWPHRSGVEEELASYEYAEALLYRALLYEVEGRVDREVELLERILALFPGRTVVGERIAELKRGDKPAVLASGLWKRLIEQHESSLHKCDRDHEGGEGHVHTDTCDHKDDPRSPASSALRQEQ